MEHLEQLIDIPEMGEVLDLLQHAESLEDNARNLKAQAEQLRSKRKRDDLGDPDHFKRPYHFHEKKIEERMSQLSDADLVHNIAMSRLCFEELADRYAECFPKWGLSSNGQSVSPRERMYMALYSFRHDTKKHDGSFAFRCSANTFWESVDMTIDVLHEHMCPEWIMLPTPDEARQQSLLFRARSNFLANAWCATDGLLVKVRYL